MDTLKTALKSALVNTFVFGLIFFGGLALLKATTPMATRLMVVGVYFFCRLVIDGLPAAKKKGGR